MESNHETKRTIKPLTVPLSSFLGFNTAELEKERDALRKKNRCKFVDSKWLKNVIVISR